MTYTVDNHCGFWQSQSISSQTCIAMGNGCNLKILPKILWLQLTQRNVRTQAQFLGDLMLLQWFATGTPHTQAG